MNFDSSEAVEAMFGMGAVPAPLLPSVGPRAGFRMRHGSCLGMVLPRETGGFPDDPRPVLSRVIYTKLFG